MRWWSTIACVTLSVLITCVVQPCVATEQWEPNHPVGHRRQTWRKEEYPHAWYDRELCRTSTGLVCDPDCILTDAQVNQMETRLQLFYNQFHDTILPPPVTNPNKLKKNPLWWSNIHSNNDLPVLYGTHVKISVVLLRKVRFIFSVHTGHDVPKYSARCRSDTQTHTHVFRWNGIMIILMSLYSKLPKCLLGIFTKNGVHHHHQPQQHHHHWYITQQHQLPQVIARRPIRQL
jgi:hypothetical protein